MTATDVEIAPEFLKFSEIIGGRTLARPKSDLGLGEYAPSLVCEHCGEEVIVVRSTRNGYAHNRSSAHSARPINGSLFREAIRWQQYLQSETYRTMEVP